MTAVTIITVVVLGMRLRGPLIREEFGSCRPGGTVFGDWNSGVLVL